MKETPIIMRHQHKSNYHQSYGAERKLQILKQGFQQDVKCVDLCRSKDVPLTTYYRWRRQLIYAALHGSDYEKICRLTEQKEKLRLENRCLREVLFSMIGRSLSLRGKALSLREIEPV